ncbi:MAG: hypothetical protein QM534_13870 [Sediminibacterium sp.]|nr:hypothetical protein [Sediminibacterium sp.]
MQRPFKCILIVLFFSQVVPAQKIYTLFHKDSARFYLTQDTIYLNKTIPVEYREVINIALQYYPELKRINIKFRLKRARSPLSARPTLWAVFRQSSKRKYIITISRHSYKKLDPVLLKNLSFNSQIGVIGHELAHVSFYQSKRGLYFIKLVLMQLSPRVLDAFEFATDKTCIERGLGFQLLSWSKEVRKKLDLRQWGGSDMPESKRERYMNPKTIINHINMLPVYFSVLK